MKKFECTLLRSQYQIVEIEAEDYEQAEENACELFDETKTDSTYIEVYDLIEVKPIEENEDD